MSDLMKFMVLATLGVQMLYIIELKKKLELHNEALTLLLQ